MQTCATIRVLLCLLAAVLLVGCGTGDKDMTPAVRPAPVAAYDPCRVDLIRSLEFVDSSKKEQAVKLGGEIPGYGAEIEFSRKAESFLQDIRQYSTDSVQHKAAIAMQIADCMNDRANEFRATDTYKAWSTEKKAEFDTRAYEQSDFYLKKVSEIIQGNTPPPPEFPAADIRVELYEHDNFLGDRKTIYRDSRAGATFGDIPHLRVLRGWNDKVRSLTLHGPPGTSLRIYDSDNYQLNDDAMKITIPDGATQVSVARIDSDPVPGVRWLKDPDNDHEGLAGKVTSIRWN